MKTRKDDVTIARRLASQEWGPDVQSQRKLADGIWEFTTDGHGGIIVDINKYPQLAEFKSTVYIKRNSDYYYEHEQHFAAFEEDCQASIVEWNFPYISKPLMKYYRGTQNLTYAQWQQQRLKSVYTSLQKWNLDYLDKHPKHGPLEAPSKKVGV